MNLAVGVAESYQEGIPVLAIVGQIPTALNGVGGFQDSSGIGHTVNAEGLWSAISKDVRVISDPATFWTDLREVVESVLSPRPGPGVLLIAKDVFHQPLVGRRAIAKTKGESVIFVEPQRPYSECSPFLVALLDLNVVVPRLHVQHSEVLGTRQAVKDLFHAW